MRSGSVIWLIVAGPFAQLRPRDPGWAGLPSTFLMDRSSLSTYASRPHADSQLKHVVGTSMNSRATLRGCALASYCTKESHCSGGGKLRRPSCRRSPGRSTSMRSVVIGAPSRQGDVLAGADEHALVRDEGDLH